MAGHVNSQGNQKSKCQIVFNLFIIYLKRCHPMPDWRNWNSFFCLLSHHSFNSSELICIRGSFLFYNWLEKNAQELSQSCIMHYAWDMPRTFVEIFLKKEWGKKKIRIIHVKFHNCYALICTIYTRKEIVIV